MGRGVLFDSRRPRGSAELSCLVSRRDFLSLLFLSFRGHRVTAGRPCLLMKHGAAANPLTPLCDSSDGAQFFFLSVSRGCRHLGEDWEGQRRPLTGTPGEGPRPRGIGWAVLPPAPGAGDALVLRPRDRSGRRVRGTGGGPGDVPSAGAGDLAPTPDAPPSPHLSSCAGAHPTGPSGGA